MIKYAWKHCMVIFLILQISPVSGQQILFSRTINELEVQVSRRLSPELKSGYMQTRYTRQEGSLSKNDFQIMLLPELVVRFNFDRMYYYPVGSYSFTGTITGIVGGEASFSVFGNRLSGMVMLTDGRKFIIDQVDENIYAISLIYEEVFRQRDSLPDYVEDTAPDDSLPRPDAVGICDAGNTCPSSSFIDLMVLYTQLAQTNWGGATNTVANITQAVTNMNVALTNSGVNNVTFRLVHTALVTYTESGSFNTDLTRLKGTSDGYMDNIHALRDQYGADMVGLIIGTPTSFCGLGNLNTSATAYSSTNGFNVSLYSCVVGNFTMAHEFGHNMGLRHDWYVDGSTTPCSHHHGYVNQTAVTQGTASQSSTRWRTIMAYNDQCSDAGISCTRVNRWSNPLVTYNGEATGRAIGNTQPADEAYAFYRMACMVAAFRSEPPDSVQLLLKVLIDGFYRGGGVMTGILSPTVTDTVTVMLAASTPPYSIIHSDKQVIDIAGNGVFRFPPSASGSSYYLVIRHRNSLETWSSQPVAFSSTPAIYDFTTAASKAFGSNQVSFGDGRYGIWSGDISRDNVINTIDRDILSVATSAFLKGYVPEDLTGDSFSESADFSLMENRLTYFLSTLKP